MNIRNRAIFGLVGAGLLFEGLIIRTDYSLFGMPSLIIAGFHVHHWMIGAMLVLIGVFLDE